MVHLLRGYLLVGLVVHKAIWELLKWRRKRMITSSEMPRDNRSKKAVRSLPIQFVKAIKIAILLGVAIQTVLPEILPISSEPSILRLAGAALYTLGIFVAIHGRLELGTNWSDIEMAQILRGQTVVSKGLYRFIRHPIYVGDLLLIVGLELALNSWLVLGALVLAPVVLWRAVQEEKKLSFSLPGYQDYCEQTKRFIPFVI